MKVLRFLGTKVLRKVQRYKDAEAQRFKNLAPQNLRAFKKKSGKITVAVYPPWTREVAGSNPVSQTNAGMAEWQTRLT